MRLIARFYRKVYGRGIWVERMIQLSKCVLPMLSDFRSDDEVLLTFLIRRLRA